MTNTEIRKKNPADDIVILTLQHGGRGISPLIVTGYKASLVCKPGKKQMYRMGSLSLAWKTLEGPPNICYLKNESLWSFVMRGSIINSEVSKWLPEFRLGFSVRQSQCTSVCCRMQKSPSGNYY